MPIVHDSLPDTLVAELRLTGLVRILRGKRQLCFTDQDGARLKGTERQRCELTLRDGKVVYDLNNLTGEGWDELPADDRGLGDPRWNGMTEGGGGRGGRGGGR